MWTGRPRGVGVLRSLYRDLQKRESVIFQKSVYCFVHLSIQEFLAAVFMFHLYTIKNKRIIESVLKYLKPNDFFRFAGLLNNDPATSLDDFLRRALMESLESKNGHLDLFVRFLHGLSLESNQRILGGLLDQMENHPETIQKVLNNLKEVNSDEISLDRSINIFHCLMEMKDQSVHQEIQEFLKSEKKSERRLSEIHCSALAYLLQMSEEVLDELNLQQYNTSEEGRRRLIPAVRNCRKVELSRCRLSEISCDSLASALRSNPSHLRVLELSETNLQDPAVKLLCGFLQDPLCKLETLRLWDCCLSKNSCDSLASALRSNPSHLRVLELSGAKLKDPAVKLLCGFLQDPLCKLETLRSVRDDPVLSQVEQKPPAEKVLSERKWWRTMKLAKLHLSSRDGLSWSCGTSLSSCSLSKTRGDSVASALKSNLSHLRVLDLSFNTLQDSGVKRLCSGLESPNCKLERLRLDYCRLSEISCDSLASALRSNPSHLRELDLSFNQLQDPAVKLLCGFLQDPLCKLETLRLWDCRLSEISCDSLASALRSNPSHLRVLDLSWNQLQDPAVKLLCGFLQDPLCKLETLSQKPKPASLLKGQQVEQKPPAEKVLSERKWWRTMKLAKLHLSSRDGLSWSCGTSSEVQPLHLRVLDLSYNTLQDSGVKRLCSGLESPNCELETLRLDYCRLSEISCGSLASALRSNPSHLRELDLSRNQLQDSGVKLLCGFLHFPNCRLETLGLRCCSLSEISCDSLASVLRSNPSHLRELDLSENKLQDSGAKLLSDLVENPHYGLETLRQ
ncbi:Ribonuclease inhibitor [Takifugu flavidus]|uniref:Ribonuclease inhibitor n=1 Tax=Takifugu flavidus TaxID=433684 RepID=A0A5C6NWE3_9TELE|nr:Ribonuclease inhibitor [Takifugu flavidus]